MTAALIALGAAAGARTVPAREALPVSEADICAIAARPEAPGRDQMGDPERGGKANAVVEETRWRTVRWGYEPSQLKMYGDWGACSISRIGFDSLEVSPDGRYALTQGGWQAGPLEGGWGYCLFEKTGAGWEPVACAVTAVS